MTGRPWSKPAVKWLRDHWFNVPLEEVLSHYPDRSRNAVEKAARHIGLPAKTKTIPDPIPLKLRGVSVPSELENHPSPDAVLKFLVKNQSTIIRVIKRMKERRLAAAIKEASPTLREIKRRRQRTIIFVVADSHVGHKKGLAPPEMWDRCGPENRKLQHRMWRHWRQMIVHMRQAKLDGWRIVVVFLGDINTGKEKADEGSGVYAISIPEQVKIAVGLLSEIVIIADEAYLIRGTPYHTGKEPLAEMMIAKELGIEFKEEMIYHTGRFRFHFSHKVSVTKGPLQYAPTAVARELMFAYAQQEVLGHIDGVIRAHRHQGVGAFFPGGTFGIITPGWQGRTWYSTEGGLALIPKLGYSYIEVDGKAQAYFRGFDEPRMTEVRAKIGD